MMPAAAKCTDCWDDPHWRSIVTPVTVSGQPAVSAAVRPMSNVCSPTWPTQPQMTSSTSDGSTPARSTRLLSTCADRSAGCTPESPPLRLPTGVRTASTITASCMCCPFRKVLTHPAYGLIRILNTEDVLHLSPRAARATGLLHHPTRTVPRHGFVHTSGGGDPRPERID